MTENNLYYPHFGLFHVYILLQESPRQYPAYSCLSILITIYLPLIRSLFITIRPKAALSNQEEKGDYEVFSIYLIFNESATLSEIDTVHRRKKKSRSHRITITIALNPSPSLYLRKKASPSKQPSTLLGFLNWH